MQGATFVLVADATNTARREIRLALVLNGGVSLAIWIGGVVAEIDRARRAGLGPPAKADEIVDVYRELLDLTGSLLRTDVIAGASAGGLNGCLLATAIVSGGTIDDVRDTWVELGSFSSMLRSGLEREPQSLLKGDEYFLPRVEAELARRLDVAAARDDLEPGRRAAARTRRVELFVTGTNLTGQRVTHLDDFGSTVQDHEHRGLFWFQHEPEIKQSTFADADAPRRLARVARSSASFPGAFEASFCRVDGPDGGPSSPSLSGIASFARDAWVIDGGVLDNAPFRPALEAIRRAPASVPVQRILCYVTPYATSPEERSATRDAPPRLASVVGAAFNLPRDVSLTDTLEDVAEYKRRVRTRRASRATLAVRLGDAGLRRYARRFHADYVELRSWSTAEEVLQRVLAGPAARRAQGARRAVPRPAATGSRLVGRGVRLPWIPPQERDDGAAWQWGLAPIVRSSQLVLDLLARTLGVTPNVPSQAHDDALARIVRARFTLSCVTSWTRQMRDAYFAEADVRLNQLKALDDAQRRAKLAEWNGADLEFAGIGNLELEDLARLVAATAAYRSTVDAAKGRAMMERVARALGEGGGAAIELLVQHEASGIAPGRRASLLTELQALVGEGGRASDEQRTRRLLDLEVIYEALVPTQRDHDQTLLFLRLNAEARCELAPQRDTPDEKLAGLRLGHFASFYKGSWRANDWMWGRMDGVSRLVDVLLDPWAIRLELESPAARTALADRLVAIGLASGDVERAIRREVDALAGWSLENEPPNRLAAARTAVRRRLQLLVAREELPAIAAAAERDADRAGAAPDAAGVDWAATVPDTATATDVEVEQALTRLPLPRDESFATELGSNLLTRNLATVAAVSTAALAGPHGGVPKAVRLVPRALRGLFLPFYALTWGLTTRRPLVRALTLLGVVLAAAVVVWGVFADVDARQAAGNTTVDVLDTPPGWLHALAVAVLLGALTLGVLRGGGAGIAVLAGFAIVYLGLVFTPAPDDVSDAAGRLWRTEPVLVAGVALLACGLVASLLARPLAAVTRLRRRRRPAAQSGSNSS